MQCVSIPDHYGADVMICSVFPFQITMAQMFTVTSIITSSLIALIVVHEVDAHSIISHRRPSMDRVKCSPFDTQAVQQVKYKFSNNVFFIVFIKANYKTLYNIFAK